LFYSLKDEFFEPTKIYANGIKRKPKEETKTITGSGTISEGIDKVEKIGERTKRKYNSTKLRKPPFNFDA
jgi:hypothetical protein